MPPVTVFGDASKVQRSLFEGIARFLEVFTLCSRFLMEFLLCIVINENK